MSYYMCIIAILHLELGLVVFRILEINLSNGGPGQSTLPRLVAKARDDSIGRNAVALEVVQLLDI